MARKFYAAIAFILFAMAALPSAGQTKTNEPAWVKSLPVPAGTSVKNPPTLLQKVQLQTISDIRETDKYVWIAGRGIVEADDGRLIFSSASSAAIELTITDIFNTPVWSQCKKILNEEKASREPVEFTGYGYFKSENIDHSTNPVGPFLGIVEITSIASCEAVK